MVEILADLGASAEWTGPNEVRVDAASVTKTELDSALGREIRASFLLAGPLLARFGRATVPPPGGDVIGRRRLDTHIHAFMELGVEVELNGAYSLRTDGLRGKRMFLDEASVMATENAVMAAVLAARRDDRRARRLRASHPGPLPLPRLARRPDRRDRLEHPADHGCGRSPRRRAIGSGRSTSRSRASPRSPRRRGATSRSRTSSRTT